MQQNWLVWYTFAILGISAVDTYNETDTRNYPSFFVAFSVGNWLLWLLPAWGVVTLVRRIRK